MDEIYLVMASDGCYSEQVEQRVLAFRSKEAAELYMEMLADWLEQVIRDYGEPEDGCLPGCLDGERYQYDVARLPSPPCNGEWDWLAWEHRKLSVKGGIEIGVVTVPFRSC